MRYVMNPNFTEISLLPKRHQIDITDVTGIFENCNYVIPHRDGH